MENRRPQFIFSLIILVTFLVIVLIILYIETNRSVSINSTGDSLMGELKILLGALTASVVHILSYWFDKSKKDPPADNLEEQP